MQGRCPKPRHMGNDLADLPNTVASRVPPLPRVKRQVVEEKSTRIRQENYALLVIYEKNLIIYELNQNQFVRSGMSKTPYNIIDIEKCVISPTKEIEENMKINSI